MLQGAGFDPAVSTMLNGVAQQDLLPTGGALIAEEFGIGSSPDSASERRRRAAVLDRLRFQRQRSDSDRGHQ